MDDNQEAALEASEAPVSEENTPVESPTTEQTPEETPSEASEQVETEGEPRKGAQQRIKELNREKKEAEERAKSLEDKLAELTAPVGATGYQQPEPQFSSQEPIVADGEEITVAELNRRIAERDKALLQQAGAQSELRMKQFDAINRINSEAGTVVRKYPQLDPQSESFDQELSDTITEATEAYVKSAPYSASVSKFVEKLMKPYTRAVESEVGRATENIAKQVSQGALRPTAVRKQEKSAIEKSIGELEAELGIVH